MKRFLTILLFSFCLLPAAFAQTVTLSGYVKDAASGETVPGAMVYTSDLKTGVNANAYGFYSLTLQRGKHVIKCASLGLVLSKAFDKRPRESLAYISSRAGEEAITNLHVEGIIEYLEGNI